MSTAPCAHLDAAKAECVIGRSFPNECNRCPAYLEGLDPHERTRCEVWSRVMGYHRPISSFNTGKRQEHSDRKYFVERPGDLEGHGV